MTALAIKIKFVVFELLAPLFVGVICVIGFRNGFVEEANAFLLFGALVVCSSLVFFLSVLAFIEKSRKETDDLEKSKTDFVSLVSHQLNTPATAVKWYTELLLDPKNLYSDDKIRYAEAIYEANDRMINLIKFLLNVSRVDLDRLSVKPVEIDFEKLAREVAEEMRSVAMQKRIALAWDIPAPLPPVFIDPEIARIIIQNLLSNAIKYVPGDGKVTTSISVDGKKLYLSVSDTGIGIPEKDKAKVFQKMFRAQNALKYQADGTGLGLYLVKAVLDLIGGTISFDSKEGQGTIFRVEFPVKNTFTKEGILLNNSKTI